MSSAAPKSDTAAERPLVALGWMTASALGFSVLAVYFKILAAVFPPFELVFFRSAVSMAWVLGILLVRRNRFWKSAGNRLLWFRGVVGFLGVACMVYSLGHLPMPIATLLNWCSPLFVIVLSRVILGERMPPLSLLFLPIAFVGLALLLDVLGIEGSQGLGLSGWAVLAGVGAAAFGGMAYVAVRVATAQAGVNTIVFYFVAVSTLISAPLTAMSYRVPTASQWRDLLILGTAATVGQLTMTQAYRFAPAGVVSVMSLLNPLFGVVLGLWLFAEPLAPLQWAGMGCVGVAIVGLTLSASHREALRQEA